MRSLTLSRAIRQDSVLRVCDPHSPPINQSRKMTIAPRGRYLERPRIYQCTRNLVGSPFDFAMVKEDIVVHINKAINSAGILSV